MVSAIFGAVSVEVGVAVNGTGVWVGLGVFVAVGVGSGVSVGVGVAVAVAVGGTGEIVGVGDAAVLVMAALCSCVGPQAISSMISPKNTVEFHKRKIVLPTLALFLVNTHQLFYFAPRRQFFKELSSITRAAPS